MATAIPAEVLRYAELCAEMVNWMSRHETGREALATVLRTHGWRCELPKATAPKRPRKEA